MNHLSVVFFLGLLLGGARRHPLRALRVLWKTLRTGWTAIRCPLVLNPVIVLAAGFLTEAAVGSGAALVLAFMLATQLPWRGGNRAALGRAFRWAFPRPSAEERGAVMAAFQEKVKAASPEERRQLALELKRQLINEAESSRREDRLQQLKCIEEALAAVPGVQRPRRAWSSP